MKIILAIVAALVVALAALLFLKVSLAREGYNSWEAVRNNLWRDGQVAVELSEGSVITNASCSRGLAVTWKKNRAVVKAGYEWGISISVEYETRNGEHRQATIKTDKPSNWTRIRFVQDQNEHFRMIENGIEQHVGFEVTNKTTEPASAPDAEEYRAKSVEVSVGPIARPPRR